jgi:hypothetical protein
LLELEKKKEPKNRKSMKIIKMKRLAMKQWTSRGGALSLSLEDKHSLSLTHTG